MNKVFLSHSSKQKGFVEVIARKLGKNRIVYDSLTFDAGKITIEEIYKGIDSTGIFIFFISEESLNSEWVKKEILKAEEYINKGKIKKFLPVIIDDKISYKSDLIPSWIKENYNLKYFSKPTKVFDLIKQSLILVNWELYPKKKELSQLFIGRTVQIKEFEQRIFDYEKPTPSTIIVSGLPSIGRRKFIKHVLSNSNNIDENYEPPIIILDNRNSIEDFIVKIYGLGYSDLEVGEITNLSEKDIDTKVNIAFSLLEELDANNNTLFIIDNLSIVLSNGKIVDWYMRLIAKLESINNTLICLISNSKLKDYLFINSESLYSINIPELEPYERSSLFQALLRLDDIQLNKEDFKVMSGLFSGYPEQISYATSLIKSEGINYVISNLNEIIDFNSEKVSRVLRKFQEVPLAVQILKILSDAEYVSIIFLKEILKDDFMVAEPILTEFSNSFIIEFIGATKEFIRLNDSIKDYVQRINYSLNQKYNNNINEHVKNNFAIYDSLQSDTSEYMIAVKEALKRGYSIPKELLLPSHYLNAMKELYNNERKYKEVTQLADRALLNKDYLDSRIIKEIRYWLCLALSRQRDERLLREVQFIQGADHNFLLGFYYRLKGRNLEAIEKFNKVLSLNPKFYRAKRELVQVYLNTEKYEEALELAKENYYLDKNNPYNLQSYYRCLIKSERSVDKMELQRLLFELERNPHEKANEMFLTAKAQYLCFVENDKTKSLQFCDDAIASYKKVIYPYLTKLDVLRKFKSIDKLKSEIENIENIFDKDHEIFGKLTYLVSKAIVISVESGEVIGKEYCELKIKGNFSQTIFQNAIEDIESIR